MALVSLCLVALYVMYMAGFVYLSEDKAAAVLQLFFCVVAGLIIMLLLKAQ